MSVIKETVEKAVNMISPDTTEKIVKGHSSQSSITSTTSNLLKQTKEQNSFDLLEQNAQQERNRLSNMLDNYRNSSEITTNDDESFTDADDFISNRRSTDSTPDETVVAQPQNNEVNEAESVPSDQRFEFEVTTATPPRPKALQFSPDLSNLSQGNLPSSPSSAFNRRSIISDYTPSIHEVNKVAYVIEGQNQSENNNEDLPVLGNTDENSKVSRKASVIKISRNSSKGSNRNNDHEKNKESINSFSSNTNSGSGSSKYPESTYSGKVYQFEEPGEQPAQAKQTQQDKILEESESTSSFEYNIGPLKTTRGQQEPIAVERSQVTGVDPAIPSRSKRRPMSSTYIKAPVNKLKEEAEQNRPKSVDIGGIDNLMVELNREIYRTPNQSSQESEIAPKIVSTDYESRELHRRQDSATNSINSEKSKRPLPPPPPPKHEKKPSVTYEDELLQDQDYVTEDEIEGELKDNETRSVKDAKKKHKKKSKTNKKRHSSGFKKGHFNHETLAQLLQVTEGTIIGQEFQNIGLEPTEKQLLERLVDSLSRLTADMVIDSDRHDESVRRLNKAIKALEGF